MFNTKAKLVNRLQIVSNLFKKKWQENLKSFRRILENLEKNHLSFKQWNL